NYRDFLAEQGPLDANHPANFVLTQCVSMNDPGLLVLPTHRLFRGVPAMTSQELQSKLKECFSTQTVGQGPELARSIWDDIEASGEQGKLAFYTAEDDTWTLATINETGASRLADLAKEHSSD